MWVESMGVSSGCGCKEVYHITYSYFLFIFFNVFCSCI